MGQRNSYIILIVFLLQSLLGTAQAQVSESCVEPPPQGIFCGAFYKAWYCDASHYKQDGAGCSAVCEFTLEVSTIYGGDGSNEWKITPDGYFQQSSNQLDVYLEGGVIGEISSYGAPTKVALHGGGNPHVYDQNEQPQGLVADFDVSFQVVNQNSGQMCNCQGAKCTPIPNVPVPPCTIKFDNKKLTDSTDGNGLRNNEAGHQANLFNNIMRQAYADGMKKNPHFKHIPFSDLVFTLKAQPPQCQPAEIDCSVAASASCGQGDISPVQETIYQSGVRQNAASSSDVTIDQLMMQE